MAANPISSPSTPHLISLPKLCRSLGVDRERGRELATRGEFPIPTLRFGDRFYVSRRAADDLLHSLTPQPDHSAS